MATPERLDLTVKRGADLYVEIECFQSDGETPMDISTWDLSGDVKSSPNSGIVAPLTVGCKAGTINVMTIAMPNAASANLPTSGSSLSNIEAYWYDIKADTGSTIEYLFQGNFNVIPRITV